MKTTILVAVSLLVLFGYSNGSTSDLTVSVDYLDNTGRDDVLSGGVKMIPVQTPKGPFRVWTKRVGNNPTIKVLLLHGGPGETQKLDAASNVIEGANFAQQEPDRAM